MGCPGGGSEFQRIVLWCIQQSTANLTIATFSGEWFSNDCHNSQNRAEVYSVVVATIITMITGLDY